MEDRCFGGLKQIQTINLTGNSLRTIPQTLFPGYNRVHLLNLDLSENDVESIQPSAFAELRYLQTLDLSRNSLRDLNDQHFIGLRSLRKLCLYNNALLNIASSTFKELINLEHLDLSDNSLQTFSGDVFGAMLPKLRRLSLKSNSLTVLQPRSFLYIPNLDYLSLSFNDLTELNADLFEPISKLKKLHITNNRIEVLSGHMFNYTQGLTELLFSHNRLTFFPDIYIDFNRLQRVALEGNPWQCPCFNWMMTFLTTRRVNYRAKGSEPYFHGEKPICVVTPTQYCVNDLAVVRQHNIVGIYEAAFGL